MLPSSIWILGTLIWILGTLIWISGTSIWIWGTFAVPAREPNALWSGQLALKCMVYADSICPFSAIETRAMRHGVIGNPLWKTESFSTIMEPERQGRRIVF